MADQLTDKELRQEFLNLGEKNIGPITATTRALYIKKLNHLRAKNRSPARSSARPVVNKKLLGFSSDESDDETSRSVGAKLVPTKSKSIAVSKTKSQRAEMLRNTRKNTGQFGSVATTNGRDIVNENGTTDDVRPTLIAAPAVGSYGRRSLRKRVPESSPVVTKYTGTRASVADAPSAAASEQSSFSGGHNAYSLNSSTVSSRRNNTYEFSDSDMDYEDVDASDRGDSSLASPPQMMSKSVNTSAWMDETIASNTSYQSPIHDRSALSPGNRFSVITPTNAGVRSKLSYMPNVVNSTGTTAESLLALQAGRDVAQKHKSKYSHDWKQHISTYLLVLAGFFFLVLAFMYVNVRGGSGTNTPGQQLSICPSDAAPNSECLSVSSPDMVMAQVEDILNLLSLQAGKYDCGMTESTRNVSVAEITKNLQTKGYKDNIEWNTIIALIKANSEWRISIQWQPWLDDGTAIDDVVAFESQLTNMSMWCRVKKSARTVCKALLFMFAASFLVTVAIGVLRVRWRRQEEEKAQVYLFVEKIIDILKTNYEECEDNSEKEPYLAIPHVRDMIIPPAERSSQQAAWEKAVKFLSGNESRVRVETQKIAGEEFAVWRWFQPCQNGGKLWHGQAFGECTESGLNTPPSISMHCLKIRNMFDLDVEYGQNWHLDIQHAILDKCGADHDIVHIAVDKSSKEGCVYVKFATPQAAGKAFKALHGWWFDRSLVTVKYLRLERYHERFPEAAHLSAPMRMSKSEQPSSPLTPAFQYQRPTLEMA